MENWESLMAGTFSGRVENLSNSDYHSLDKYWSSTAIKYMSSTSPAHYREKYFHNKGDYDKPTYDMILGSLVHTLILTPLEFEKEFFIMPDLNFRTNEGKARRDELLILNHGKLPISQDMLLQANAMKSSCLQHRKAAEYLDGAEREVSYFWKCPLSHLNFRAKLDARKNNLLLELKTTGVSQSEKWMRHAENMNYDLSLVHYSEGYRNVSDTALESKFIVIEQDPPYLTTVYNVKSGFLEVGHAKWLDAVGKLERGLVENYWPGYCSEDDEVDIDATPWAFKKHAIGDINGI